MKRKKLKFYPEKTVVSVFGDSISYGMWDFEKHGWVNRLRYYLENRMEKDEKRYIVHNFSIPGETTSDLLKRISTEINGSDPDIVIFNIGTNDTQYFIERNEFKVDIEDFEKNIRKLIDYGNAKEVYFLGYYPVDEEDSYPFSGDPTRGVKNSFLKKYHKVLGKVCRESGVGFVDFWNEMNKSDLSDGLHPNEKGHEKIFRKVIRKLQKSSQVLDL